MIHSLHNLFERIFFRIGFLIFRYKIQVLLISILLTLLSIFLMRSMKLDSNLAALLPENNRIVKNLDIVSEVYGGIGNLALVIRSQDYQKTVKFIDDLEDKINAYDQIRYVEHRKPLDFFRRNILLYADLADLNRLYYRIHRKIEYERTRNNPLLLDLEEQQDPGLYVGDLIKKYEQHYKTKYNIKDNKQKQGQEFFYKQEHGGDSIIHTFVVLVKPEKSALNVKYAADIQEKVSQIITDLNPASYHPSISVSYTGRYKRSLDDFEFLRKDFSTVTIVSIIGILVILIGYFRNIWPVLLIFTALIFGILWSMGLAQFIYGNLNLITSFLVAILLGLGIDFGIHFMLRFKEERKNGRSQKRAFLIMFSQTGAASFSSALTTSLAFFGLAATDLRAFKEFGIIAGSGILLLLLSMMITFATLLIIIDERVDMKIDKKQSHVPMPAILWKYPGAYLLIALIISTVAIIGIRQVGFDYDFSKIRAKGTESQILDKEVNRMLQRSQNPTVILPQNWEEEKRIIETIQSHIDENKEQQGYWLDKVFAISTFMPENQAAKLAQIKRISNLLQRNKKYYHTLPHHIRQKWKDLEEKLVSRPIEYSDLPQIIRQSFMGIGDYHEKHVVLIFPKPNLVLGLEWVEYASQVNDIMIGDDHLQAASDELIFAEILNIIEKDGPYVLMFTLIAVFFVVSLNFSSIFEGLLIAGPLILGMVWLLGGMGISEFPVDFFNVIMFPIVIGIGVDSSIHIYHRYKETGDVLFAVRHTGEAVALSSLTTILGFGALLWASNDAMKSMGTVAIAGIGVTFLVSTFLLPSLIQVMLNFKQRRVK